MNTETDMVARIVIPSTTSFVYIEPTLLKHQGFGKVGFDIQRTR
jgi:hypothetical protein